MNKQELLDMLEAIKKRVSGGEQFVCNIALRYVERKFNLYPHEAKEHPVLLKVLAMVKMHLGNYNTMEGFLHQQFELSSDESVGYDVVKSYRIAMLNNMIKMVKGEPHA